MGRKLSKKACHTCRDRHLRCDEDLPVCRRCRKDELWCDHRTRHEFRHVHFSNAGRQKRSEKSIVTNSECRKTNESQVIFVDETASTAQIYTTPEGSEREHQVPSPSISAVSSDSLPSHTEESRPRHCSVIEPVAHTSVSPGAPAALINPPSIVGLPLTADIQNFVSEDESFPYQRTQITQGSARLRALLDFPAINSYPDQDATFGVPSPFNMEHASSSACVNHDTVSPLSHSSFPTDVPTISGSQEAFLVKFFAQTWGPIFDCLDSESTFTRTATRLALTSSQPLLWAILATSALQLSRISNFPFAAAQYYRSQCSKHIMPILLTPGFSEVHEDTLFATYVMLRNYEHMTGQYNLTLSRKSNHPDQSAQSTFSKKTRNVFSHLR